MEELFERVWGAPAFHEAADRLRKNWLCRELGLPFTAQEPADLQKVIQASAILACSRTRAHRESAYRIATSAFELHGSSHLPLAEAARVVLARLGNFPAMRTRREIETAAVDLPMSLLAEELVVSDLRTVTARERKLVLTDFQYKLWKRLAAGRRLAVAAPTSAGKSFVLQNFLGARFDAAAPMSVVYIVPTRALIAQVSSDLRKVFGRPEKRDETSVEVRGVPIEPGDPLPGRVVYVMTQERVRMMLSAHPGFAAEIVIVDEAHSVADGARGVLLQWVIDDLLRRRPLAQLMFASPGVRNLDVFGDMFGLEDVEPLPSAEPTVAQNFLKAKIEDGDVGDILIQAVDEQRTIDVGTVSLRRRCVTRVERLVSLSTSLGRGASNIIYADGAGDAETLAEAIADRLERDITPEREALARLAAENVHRSYILVKCVRKGVAFHYSNMPTPVRQAIEDAVRSGVIDYLVCTTTLLQGVNLPAKNLFICKPYKGEKIPLESVDFWNLAGRAGRLLKEFQGNIFLIDYENWRQKPLDKPRDAAITPAVDVGVLQRTDALIGLVERVPGYRTEDDALEAVFGRLLDDRLHGDLAQTLARVPGFDPDLETNTRLVKAVTDAAKNITLPSSVLRGSPNISPHKQQDLYEALWERGSVSKDAALKLIPLHPRHGDAYGSYRDILELCHQIILGLPSTNGSHRFLALICLFWMRGRPLPMIVQNQLRRKRPEDDDRDVVRDTLKLVENRVRYQCLRLFSCYSSVLVEVLRNLGHEEALSRLPSISLYLELGASDRTTLSLMAMNLSRVVAVRLTPRADSRDLDVDQARAWLLTAPIETFGFSPLLEREIRIARGEILD